MKTSIRFLIVCSCIFFQISPAQWVQTNGPFGGAINDFVVNDSILFTINPEGLFQSTDNGEYWTRVNSHLQGFNNLQRFAMIGSNLFVSSFGGGVFRSTDNGANWFAVDSGLSDGYIRTIIVSSDNLFAGTETNGVFFSSDTGESWIAVNSGLGKLDVYTLELSGSTLFALTNNGIFRTTDNGNNWVHADSGLPKQNLDFSYHICFADSTAYCAVSNNGIYVSANNGTTWTLINSSEPMRHVGPLFIHDANLLAATCGFGMFRSTDSGASWTNIDFPIIQIGCFYSSEPYLYAGPSNGVYRSMDNGVTWAQVNQGLTVPVKCVARAGTTLYAGTRSGGIFLTTDNGTNWIHLAECTGYVDAIAATDTTIFASNMGSSGHGPDGDIFRSTDNGKTWWTVNSGLTTTNVPALVISSEFIFAGTLGARVFRSINNGNTWTYAGSDITNDTVWSLAATETNLYAGTNDGVFRSTDDGASWNQIGLTGNSINSLAASDSMIIAHAWPDGLCISTDNGATWSTSINLSKKDFRSDVELRNDYLSKTSFSLADINALAVSNGYLYAGTSQSVWKIPISQITAVNKPGHISPTIFQLDQNYPNPFNPSTVIRYQLPINSFVTLKVYDLLGREVAVMVNEKKDAGRYSVQWDASHSASGVYLCRMNADNFTSTKKLVLIH